MVYIATDHRGFEIKKKINGYFQDHGIIFTDIGPFELHPEDDYPLFAFELCENVLKDPGSKGVLICGTGGGMCIAANKVIGIRAAEAESPEEAILIRTDDDANVLVLSKLEYDPEHIMLIIEAFLNTEFSNAERHVRRLKEISDYEKTHNTTEEPKIQNGDTPGASGNQL